MRLATAFVEVRPDTSKFRVDLEKQTTDDAAAAGRKLSQVLAGGAFLAGAKRAIDASSNLNEAMNVTKITFGAAEDQVSAFAKTAAESIGQSEAAARSATATFGGLLLNLGLTEDEAAKTSISLTKLASDLGSAFNTDPAEAALALSSALRGEQEPILRYNVLLSDQSVRQEAVRLGLAATTAAVDENGKVQARLSLIMEQTSRVQGDFANTSDGVANAQRIAAAEAENAAADMGDNLIPIYERLVAVTGAVAQGFGALPEPVQTAVIALAGIVALTGPVKIAGEAMASLATIARAQLSRGLDVAATGAYSLSGNLGKAALGMGALGAAVGAASILFSSYQRTKAEMADIEAEYTRILGEQSDAVGENSRAFAGSEILKGALGEALRAASADVDVFTDSVLSGSDALDGITSRDLVNLKNGTAVLGDVLDQVDPGPLADELLRLAESGKISDDQLVELIARLQVQTTSYENSTREAKNKAAADEAAGDAASGAAPKVDQVTEALSSEEQAAKDAADAVDAFREAVEKALAPLDFEEAVDAQAQALDDLAQGIADREQAVEEARQRIADLQAGRSDQQTSDARRIQDAEEALTEARARAADTDAERASKVDAIKDAEENLARARADAGGDTFERDMAEAQQALSDAIADTSLTLEGNTDQARRNREELRNLVDESVAVIEAGIDQKLSLEELQNVRRLEVESLRTQLTEMGYTREEVDRYIGRIEAIPLTKTTVLDVDTAKADIKIKEALARWQRQIDLNPLSIDVAIAEKFANGPRTLTGVPETAAGGNVMDGLFSVGEAGRELLRKSGDQVEVIAGSPAALSGATYYTTIAVYGTTGESPAEALTRSARRIGEEVASRA